MAVFLQKLPISQQQKFYKKWKHSCLHISCQQPETVLYKFLLALFFLEKKYSAFSHGFLEWLSMCSTSSTVQLEMGFQSRKLKLTANEKEMFEKKNKQNAKNT